MNPIPAAASGIAPVLGPDGFRGSKPGRPSPLRLRPVALAAIALGAVAISPARAQVVVTPIGSYTDRAYGALLLPDQRVVAAGMSVVNPNEDTALAVYFPDGTLDPSFGGDGIATTYFNKKSTSTDVDYARSVVTLGNGLVSGGVACTYPNSKYVSTFALTWWNASGGVVRKVTTAFSGTNKTGPQTKAEVRKLLVAADGSLVAVGNDVGGGTRLAVARYNASGTLLAQNLSNLDMNTKGAALQGNKILAVGSKSGQVAVARLDLNGKLDATWGTGGLRLYPLGSDAQAECVTLDDKGQIVVGGSALFDTRGFVVMRLNPNGSPDSSFNGTGTVALSLGGAEDVVTAVNLRANGLIVATGYTSSPDGTGGTVGKFAAAQFFPDGLLDVQGFGAGGVAVVPVSDSSFSYDATIRSDGKLVLVGEAKTILTTTPKRTSKINFAWVGLSPDGTTN
jgi:serralysin